MPLPQAHVGGIPVEESLLMLLPAIATALAAGRASLGALINRLRRRGGPSPARRRGR